MKKYTYLICTIFALHCSLVHPMDQTCQAIKSNELMAFEILLNQGVTIFNHKLVCSLALVSKLPNQRIKDTAHLRKKRLERIATDYKNQRRLVWHTYGGAYAYMHDYEIGLNNKLTMFYIYLSKKNQTTNMFATWNNEPHEVLYNPGIFFNPKGDACYYASGIMDVLGHGRKREIIEYSLSIHNQAKQTRCVLGRNNKKKEFQTISLAHIAKNSFPDLTQAILNSSNQYELSTVWHKDKIKVFHWDGVKVPTRYLKSQLYLDSQGKLIVPL